MDFSQFSDEDLVALKNNNYAQLSDQALLALKGQTTQKAKSPSLKDQIKDKVMGAYQKAQPYLETATAHMPTGPAELLAEYPGLESAALHKLPEVVTQGMEKIAPGSSPGVQPQLAAIKYAPEIAMTAGLAPAAEKALPRLTNMAESLENLPRTIGRKIGKTIETLKGPTTEEARALNEIAERSFKPNELSEKAGRYTKETIDPVKAEINDISSRLDQLPLKRREEVEALEKVLAEKKAALLPKAQEERALRSANRQLAGEKLRQADELEAMRADAGSQIEAARTSMGMPQKLDAVEVPTNIDEFADSMKALSTKTPQELQEAFGTDGLVHLRDTISATMKTATPQQRAVIQRGAETINSALPEELGTGYKTYGEIRRKMDDLPDVFAKKRAAIQNSLSLLDKKFAKQMADQKAASEALKNAKNIAGKEREVLSFQLKEANKRLRTLQADAKALMQDVKVQNKMRKEEMHKKSIELLRRGVEHDRLVKNIYKMVGLGTAAGFLKSALGAKD